MAREAPIATINGIGIYSDKQIQSINNTRVTFSDGSWCDVVSGSCHVVGKGYISIGNAFQDAGRTSTEQRVTVEKRFESQRLEINSVCADVDVVVGTERGMIVQMVGPQSLIDQIRLEGRHETLLVSGAHEASATMRGSGISISGLSIRAGGNIIIGNVQAGGEENPLRLTITVPIRTPLVIQKVIGDVNVGDTLGGVRVAVFGNHNVKLGMVGAANLHVQGSGEIEAVSVTETLIMNVHGSGSILVEDGKVRDVVCNLIGSGSARFDGMATMADLTLTGSGRIKVRTVVERPNRVLTGSGSIKVGGW
jgi:hypothetical protein